VCCTPIRTPIAPTICCVVAPARCCVAG